MQEYRGKKNCCSICERHFKPGDPVFVVVKEDVILCYDDGTGNDIMLVDGDD